MDIPLDIPLMWNGVFYPPHLLLNVLYNYRDNDIREMFPCIGGILYSYLYVDERRPTYFNCFIVLYSHIKKSQQFLDYF